jgi:hypothetical protein
LRLLDRGYIASGAFHLAVIAILLASFATTTPLNTPPPATIAVDLVPPPPDEQKPGAAKSDDQALVPDVAKKDGVADLMASRDGRGTTQPQTQTATPQTTAGDKTAAPETPQTAAVQTAREKAAAAQAATRDKTTGGGGTKQTQSAEPPAQILTMGSITERPGVAPPLELSGLIPELQDGGVGQGSGESTGLPATTRAAVRAKIRQCWHAPANIAGAENLKIKIRLVLSRDGKLLAPPDDIAVAGATQGMPQDAGPRIRASLFDAITSCAPYDMLPPDKYDDWKVFDVDLSPRELAGG